MTFDVLADVVRSQADENFITALKGGGVMAGIAVLAGVGRAAVRVAKTLVYAVIGAAVIGVLYLFSMFGG